MTVSADLRGRVEAVIRKSFPQFRGAVEDKLTAKEVPGWDSVAHFNLVMAVEDEFGVELDSSRIYALRNVGELISLVAETVGKAGL